MKKIILLLLIFVSLLVLNISLVNACSCIQPAPPLESLEQSSAVFAGKVVDITVPRRINIRSDDPIKVTFEVSQIWKGPDYKTIILTTARDGVSCGYSFKENEEYIVYTYGEEDELSTSICSRTKLLSNAQEDLQDLGAGDLPTISDSNYLDKNSNFMLVTSIAIILIIIFLYLKFR